MTFPQSPEMRFLCNQTCNLLYSAEYDSDQMGRIYSHMSQPIETALWGAAQFSAILHGALYTRRRQIMRKSSKGLLWSVMMMITAMLLIIIEYTGNSQVRNADLYGYIGMFI